MRICLICSEFMGWGTAGGFGFATRSLGRQLARRGHEVHAVIPQPIGSSETGLAVDGMTVTSYPRSEILDSGHVYRRCNADIYHSQEPSLSTWLAQRAVPDALHVVTSRDPRLPRDWWLELRYPSRRRLALAKTWAFYENPLTHAAVRRSRAVFVPARFLRQRTQRKYRLQRPPEFLPTPVEVPDRVRKSPRPVVCSVGRLDRRKRPERLLDLAPRFPEVEFVVVGRSQDPDYERRLLQRFGGASNLRIVGFVDQFTSDRLSQVLGAAWVLINTAAREGLPNAFIEAAAHRCAILSPTDPDGFASRFGVHCPDEDYASGLRRLLDGDAWRRRGEAGWDYVRITNAAELATDLHLRAYERLLQAGA